MNAVIWRINVFIHPPIVKCWGEICLFGLFPQTSMFSSEVTRSVVRKHSVTRRATSPPYNYAFIWRSRCPFQNVEATSVGLLLPVIARLPWQRPLRYSTFDPVSVAPSQNLSTVKMS